MTVSRSESRIHRRLIDSLYTEAMLLADEARSYFDEAGRLVFSCLTRSVFSRATSA